MTAKTDEFDVTIAVTHYPPGASKWNPIDHRMFSLISANWAGEPLISYEAMLKYMHNTLGNGFHCLAYLDKKSYDSQRPTEQRRQTVHMTRRSVCPQWTYLIFNAA